MQAQLIFNLPEDDEAHWLALNGWRYMSVLRNLDNTLRLKAKHENDRAAGILREVLHKECEDMGVEI